MSLYHDYVNYNYGKSAKDRKTKKPGVPRQSPRRRDSSSDVLNRFLRL